MSSMFEQYDNLSSQYIPSNMNKGSCLPKQNPFLDPLVPKKPYEEINAEGELVGYWWNYGDTINLEFELSGQVEIENDSLPTYVTARDFINGKQIQINIYNFRHEQILTKLFDGKDYQEFLYEYAPYVTKKTSGIFYTYNDGTYTAVQLPENFEQNTKYYKQKDVTIVFPIDEDISKSLTKGIYYCSLIIIDENNMYYTIINQNDFTLTVK